LATLTTTTTATAAKTSLSSGAKINNDTISDLEKKMDHLTKGAPQYFRSIFMKMADANLHNAKTLCEFISVETNEYNLKLSSRLTKIKELKRSAQKLIDLTNKIIILQDTPQQ
jgi:hypothetical protein